MPCAVRGEETAMLRGAKVSKAAVRLCAAARIGDIKTLERSSRSALNQSDDQGLTPAMWSAAHGQLSALRVVVERGFVIHPSLIFQQCTQLYMRSNTTINAIATLPNASKAFHVT